MIVTELRATPVAIKDPPLRSAFGLHAPFALRTIVEIETVLPNRSVAANWALGPVERTVTADAGRASSSRVGLSAEESFTTIGAAKESGWRRSA